MGIPKNLLLDELRRRGRCFSYAGPEDVSFYAVARLEGAADCLPGVAYVGPEEEGEAVGAPGAGVLRPAGGTSAEELLRAAEETALSWLRKSERLLRVYEHAAKRGDCHAVARACHAAMGNPVAVFGAGRRLVTDTLPESAGKAKAALLRKLENMAAMEPDGPESACSRLLEAGAGFPWRCLVAAAAEEGKEAVFFAAVECGRPFSALDAHFAGKICSLLAGLWRDEPLLEETRPGMLESLLTELLRAAPDSPAIAREQLKTLQWPEKEKYYVLAVDCSCARPESDLAGAARSLRALIGAPLLTIGRGFAAVVGSDRDADLRAGDFPGLEDFLRERNLRAGLSYGFYDPLAMHRYFRQSVKSMELVAHYERTSRFCRYEDYVISHMVELCAERIDLRDICHPLAVRIRQYDQDNGTDYIRTIYAYLRLGRSIRLAAEALHIHRNTMYHRLLRLKEMFGVDFDDLGLVLKLLMSMQVYAYTRVFDVKLWG